MSLFGIISLALMIAGAYMIMSMIWNATRRNRGFFVTVYDWDYALLYVDGRFDRVLSSGRHFTFDLTSTQDVCTLPRSPQFIVMPPLDVTSADKLPFRLSATVVYQVKDPREAFEDRAREDNIRLAVTQAVQKLAAEQTLHAFMTQRADLDTQLLGMLSSPISGCMVTSVTMTSVMLPPEIRRLFTEVERAKLEGQATLERARGEHAALRSLANAARMLKGNPELMNLRVLQALSVPNGKRTPTLVLGQGALLPIGEDKEPVSD